MEKQSQFCFDISPMMLRVRIFNRKLLVVSFFGARPCPEFYRLKRYLAMAQASTRISPARFDTQPWWEHYSLDFMENSQIRNSIVAF